jgi:hypothetical protein
MVKANETGHSRIAVNNPNPPTVHWAAWDDEVGFVTVPTDRNQADADLTVLLDVWAKTHPPVYPDNIRVRMVHIHDDGTTRAEHPAYGCPVCPTPTASDFGRGDKVHTEDWGDLEFTVQGHIGGPGISRLIEIVSPGGITATVPADQLRKAS